MLKSSFQCHLIPSASYSTFELQTFQLQLSSFSAMFAVVYRPPKFNYDFIRDFTDFLSCATVKYAESKWKKDKLHVSKKVLHESLSIYQSAVKTAKI